MENKRALRGASVGVWRLRKHFLSFTRCSRRGFLCVRGTVSYGRHGIMFALSLRCLRCVLFAYLGFKIFASCFNIFRRALFYLAVFHANYL